MNTKAFMRALTDQLSITEGGTLRHNFTGDQYYGKAVEMFSSKTKISANFVSGNGPIVTENLGEWYISLSPSAPPNFIRMSINETNPTLILWADDISYNDAYVVCSSTKSLQMHVSDRTSLGDFVIYDSDDLVNNLGPMTSSLLYTPATTWYPSRLSSTSGCLTIYKNTISTNSAYNSILFRIPEIQSKNCPDQNNIFNAYQSLPGDSPFSLKASSDGSCEMIIMTGEVRSPALAINKLDISDSGDFVFKNTATQKVILSLKSSEANLWQTFGIFTTALSVVIPASGSISIHTDLLLDNVRLYLNADTQKGIMLSPFYGGEHSVLTDEVIYVLQAPAMMTATFNVKELSPPNNATLSAYNPQTGQSVIFKEGQSVTMTGQQLNIKYTTRGNEKYVFFVEYTLTNGTNNDDQGTGGGVGSLTLTGALLISAVLFVL